MIPDSEIAAARARLTEVVGAEVALKSIGREFAALCPFHDERSPSFYVAPDKGFYHCFGCGAHGTAIDFVMRRRGLDFPAAVRWLIDLPNLVPVSHTAKFSSSAHYETEEGRAARVEAVLAECGPVMAGTAARLYLTSRGLSPDQPGLLAHPALFCSEIGKPLPALVAPITNSAGEVCALQRIWCAERVEFDGSDQWKDARAPLATRKKTLGHMGDGAVRLAPAGEILGLAESVEKASACQMLFRIVCWAVCGAYRFRAIGLPPDVKTVVLFGDNDATGRDQAERARQRYLQEGRRCNLVFPDDGFKGWEDQLIGRRNAA